MAKKSGSAALVFEFRSSTLKRILDKNPDKVVFTVSVEAVEAKTGGLVGALRINAEGAKFKASTKSKIGTSRSALTANGSGSSGEPHPPGMPI